MYHKKTLINRHIKNKNTKMDTNKTRIFGKTDTTATNLNVTVSQGPSVCMLLAMNPIHLQADTSCVHYWIWCEWRGQPLYGLSPYKHKPHSSERLNLVFALVMTLELPCSIQKLWQYYPSVLKVKKTTSEVYLGLSAGFIMSWKSLSVQYHTVAAENKNIQYSISTVFSCW